MRWSMNNLVSTPHHQNRHLYSAYFTHDSKHNYRNLRIAYKLHYTMTSINFDGYSISEGYELMSNIQTLTMHTINAHTHCLDMYQLCPCSTTELRPLLNDHQISLRCFNHQLAMKIRPLMPKQGEWTVLESITHYVCGFAIVNSDE